MCRRSILELPLLPPRLQMGEIVQVVVVGVQLKFTGAFCVSLSRCMRMPDELFSLLDLLHGCGVHLAVSLTVDEWVSSHIFAADPYLAVVLFSRSVRRLTRLFRRTSFAVCCLVFIAVVAGRRMSDELFSSLVLRGSLFAAVSLGIFSQSLLAAPVGFYCWILILPVPALRVFH